MSNPAPQAKPILVGAGWRKRAGSFYTRPLAPGVLGLLALAPDRGLPHQWRLKPYVGVVHEQVNTLARALMGSERESPYPQDTIRSKLVRLLDGPEAQERDRWLIAAEALDGNEGVFREVADAARDVGLPWMQKRTSLEAVVYELQDGNGPWRRTPYLTAALVDEGRGRRAARLAGDGTPAERHRLHAPARSLGVNATEPHRLRSVRLCFKRESAIKSC